MSDSQAPAPRDYKDTVNLPKTEFPMKGNLAQLEPKMLAQWDQNGTYAQLLEQTRDNARFVFHDGPPYANGHLHAGHALNKILKDIVVKYRNMAGQHCVFVPGWDCHGLPIEQAVEKRLKEKEKIDKRTLSRDQFLEKCRAYAEEFIEIQKGEFRRMGLFGLWDQPYKTLTFDYEAQEIRELATFARRGSLYRRKKPVYWCLTDQTALAEAEVEYEDHESPSVYVAMETDADLTKISSKLAGRKVAFVIWTTTPWTLPANLAIAVHPTLEYVFYELGGRVLCIAKDLLPKVLSEIAPDELTVKDVNLPGGAVEAAAFKDMGKILAYATGSDLEHLEYRHPFYDRKGKVVLGEHVTLDAGTGLVHTAPGHGQEDYEVGLAYQLEIYNPVKFDGRYDDSVGPLLAGKKVFEANPIVIQTLVEKGALLNSPTDRVKHSYPHCWRCHNPIILSATHQWFISLEKNDLRKKALAEIDKTNWVPKWGRDRIYNMLEGRPDWTISRQRTWGVPIPIAICTGCDEPVIKAELMERVADAVEKEGAGVWYRTEPTAFLPEGYKCDKCGKSEFRRETDILDVWFDSACSFAAVAGKRPGMGEPVDLYLEGSDQHRGWFHSSLLVSVGTRERSPYKTCLTHGFVVDGNGEKMSKHKGNVVAPEKVISQYGAEVLRLWVASSDYRDDVRLSDQILKGLSEGYRKVRNTIRYALSNLYDFDPAKDAVPLEQLGTLDLWARVRLHDLIARVNKAYENYEFHLVYHSIVDFCATDLSAIYFDVLKDRLYTAKSNGHARRSSQTVIHEIATALLGLLAPVMSFTAEEAWQHLPGKKAKSVFLAGMPKALDVSKYAELVSTYEKLFAVRSEVQKLLEAARRDKLIGASLEAKVLLSAKGARKALLEKHRAELPTLFIVSQVELVEKAGDKAQTVGTGDDALTVEVVAAEGQKCPRCWTYSTAVGQGADICRKCQDALAA